MKLAKKITSIASAAAMLASFAALNADAILLNQYSVSLNTLTESIQTDDGSTVPAGAVAVTIEVQHNYGFDANSFTFELGQDCTLLTNDQNQLIIQKGVVTDEALFGSCVDENRVCVTFASASSCIGNGSVFTFYALPTGNSGLVSVSNFASSPESLTPIDLGNDSICGSVVGNYYMFLRGDVTYDDVVDAADASTILAGLNNSPNGELTLDEIRANYSAYFPDLRVAEEADANASGWVNSYDATIILNFAAAEGLGIGYYGDASNYVGQPCSVPKSQMVQPA